MMSKGDRAEFSRGGGMGEWRECKLGEQINLKRGYDLPNRLRQNGEIPIYSSSGITGFHSEKMCEAPGVITGRYGTIGKIFFSNTHYWPLNTTLYIQDFKGNDELFFYYFLQRLDWEKYSDKSAVPGINRNDVHQEDIVIPPLLEQKAIASILSSLDDKIDLLHRQNRTLEAIAETLFRQWFIEEAQEDWKEGTLGSEFNFIMGQSPSGSSFNEEGIGVPMFQGNADFGFRFPKERVYTTEPTRFAKQFDTLISVRAPVGAQNMAHKECCIGRGVAAFRYKKNNSFYTYTYFKLRSLMEEIKKFNDEGTVFGSISKSDFEALIIAIPSSEFILRFEFFLKPVNDKVIKNCLQICTLEKLRDNLLPKLMSGEVQVKFSIEE
jgi:type I restriction enzyme, S subunit